MNKISIYNYSFDLMKLIFKTISDYIMNLNTESSKFVNFIFAKTDARKKLVDLLESKNLKSDSKVI